MSNKFLVYLAGPISDTSYKDSMEWREYARARLSSPYVSCLSPMRDKESICESKAISKSGYNDVNVLLQPKGIITRDRHDCFRSDVILANLLGSVFPSIGTMIEFGWADSNRIPIVCAMEKGNIHEHCIVNEIIGIRAYTLDAAIEYVKSIIGVY